MSEEKPPTNTWAGWYVIIVCLFLYMFGQVDRNVVSLMVDPIQRSLKIGNFESGLLMGVFGVGAFLFGLPISWLGDRYSHKWMIFVSAVIWSLSTCAGAYATTYEQLLATRVGVGIGEAGFLPLAYALISKNIAQDRLAIALSVLSMGAVASFGLSFGLGGQLIDLSHSLSRFDLPFSGRAEFWHWMFLISGLPAFILSFLILLIPESRTASAQSGGAGYLLVELVGFLRGNIRCLSGMFIGFGCMGLISAAFAAWIPTHISREFTWNIADAATTFGLLVLFVASVGKIGSGFVVDWMFRGGDRLAALRYYLCAVGISLPFTVAALVVDRHVPFFSLIGVYFLLAYPMMGFSSAFLQIVTPVHLRASVSAVFTLVLVGCGYLGGPIIVGSLSQFIFHGSGNIGLSLLVIVMIFMPLALFALWKSLGAAPGILGGMMPEPRASLPLRRGLS